MSAPNRARGRGEAQALVAELQCIKADAWMALGYAEDAGLWADNYPLVKEMLHGDPKDRQDIGQLRLLERICESLDRLILRTQGRGE